MGLFDEFADVLSQEVLTEMAGTFFGARRHVEDMMDALRGLALTLRSQESRVEGMAGLLNLLLLRGTARQGFYQTIGVAPEPFEMAAASPLKMPFKPPWALTLAGRYCLLVKRAYAELAEAVHDYMHGKVYRDMKDRGRKKTSVHYGQVMRFCEQVNALVTKVNADNAPSTVMQYVKNFNPEALAKERAVGSVNPDYASSLDETLDFRPVDFNDLGLRPFPDLPDPDAAADAIRTYCRKLAAENREAVAAILAEVTAMPCEC